MICKALWSMSELFIVRRDIIFSAHIYVPLYMFRFCTTELDLECLSWSSPRIFFISSCQSAKVKEVSAWALWLSMKQFTTYIPGSTVQNFVIRHSEPRTTPIYKIVAKC